MTDKEIQIAKKEKFKELAEIRVNKALKSIELIGNLSNRNNYTYSDDQVKKIFAALNKSLSNSKARFNIKNGKNGFNL